MRRRRIEELVILLTRVVAVAFLVLLFCQPIIPNKASNKLTSNAVSILLDNSGSMQALGQSSIPLNQEAVVGAQALGRNYVSTARFTLLGQRPVNMQPAAFLLAASSNQAGVTAQGWGSTEVRTVLQEEAQGPLYIFSDFQKSEMQPQFIQHVKTAGEVVLVPLTAKPTANIFVDSVWLNDAFVRARANVTLHIRFRNGGSIALANCPVKVILGKQQVASFQISVGAGQTIEATVQVQLVDNKLALGKVVTQDTPITFDNTYYFTLQPTSAIRILEIGPEPMTKAAYANEPLFTYSYAKPQAVDYGILRRANLVLLREAPQVDAGLRSALVEVTRRGGSVVIVPPGSAVAHATYSELFQALGIAGEQWQHDPNALPVRQEVLMPNARNPFFKDVFGVQPQRVAMPQVAPVVRLQRAGTNILQLRDGNGFLTEFPSRAGHVYLFAAPFSTNYSDFATHVLFVPVLYRLAIVSYRTDQLPAYRLTDPALTLSVPTENERATNEQASYRLVHDSATYIPMQRVQAEQLHLDVPTGLRAPGFYELRRQGKVVTTLAFNSAKGESELGVYSVAELRQLIGPNHPNVRVLENGEQPATLARYQAEQTGQPLWRYCLLAVLACLLAEGILLRLGQQRTAARLAGS